jgi:hypothetical protein
MNGFPHAVPRPIATAPAGATPLTTRTTFMITPNINNIIRISNYINQTIRHGRN